MEQLTSALKNPLNEGVQDQTNTWESRWVVIAKDDSHWMYEYVIEYASGIDPESISLTEVVERTVTTKTWVAK